MGMVSGKVSGPSVGAGRSRYLQRRLHEKEGAAAWAALALGVLLYDIYAMRKGKETLSICWGRWLQQPNTRKVCFAAWAVLTSHLFMSTPLPFQSKLRALASYKRVRSSQLRVVTGDSATSPLLITEQ